MLACQWGISAQPYDPLLRRWSVVSLVIFTVLPESLYRYLFTSESESGSINISQFTVYVYAQKVLVTRK